MNKRIDAFQITGITLSGFKCFKEETLVNKLNDKAIEVFNLLAKEFNCDYDTSGNIGKRYRRQDQIGTPYCVTFDFDSLEDNCVTIRDRDTMTQERIKIDELVDFISEKIK